MSCDVLKQPSWVTVGSFRPISTANKCSLCWMLYQCYMAHRSVRLLGDTQ